MECSSLLLLSARAYLALSSNTEIHREKHFGILHGLENLYHYCFAHEVHVITDHKHLLATMGKDVATLSQHLQSIILCINENKLCILHKPVPKLFTADWLPWHDPAKKKKKRTKISWGKFLTLLPNTKVLNNRKYILLVTSFCYPIGQLLQVWRKCSHLL